MCLTPVVAEGYRELFGAQLLELTATTTASSHHVGGRSTIIFIVIEFLSRFQYSSTSSIQ
jgi:hypothetical protein